jgi:phosphoheptose isomerase
VGRPALPALALTADSAVLTAWANDAGYDEVVTRQVEAHGHPGDVLLAISTSGRSPSVVRALETAARRGLRTVGLLGRDGGAAQRLVEVAITVPSADTQRIQEVHIVAIHLLCELIEARVAGAGAPGAAPARARWDSPERLARRGQRAA